MVDGDESFINVDAQGVAGADVMEIEPVEGVDVSFEDETSAVSTYAIRKIKTIKAKTEIELFTGVTADVSVKIKSPQVEYSINSNYAYVALEGDTEISYNIEANVAEMYLGDKAVELFTCSVLGVGDFTVSVEFKVSGSASGSVKGYLVAGLECTNGGKLRAIKSFQQKQYSTNIEATASVGLKVKLGITKMPVINAYVYAEAGVKANLKTTIYNNSESNKCVNFKAYLYAKYGAQASAKFGGWKTSLSVEYDIFNESNSPVKIVHHYENGMLVPFCTKGSEYSNYFTNDSSRWSGSGWTSANGAYGLSADGTPVARYTYTLDDKNNATITKYNGNSWSIYIPEKIDGYTVVGIGSNAFSNEEMVSVVIPDTVTAIESNAFYKATALKNVTLSKNLTSIESDAFRSCSSLESIVIPDTVTKIGWSAFYNCTSLKDVKLSKSLTYLGSMAFGSTAIDEIEIPKTLDNCDGSGPFYECELLKKVTFESGITKIPQCLFENCTGLESIVIPDTVTVIEGSAFLNATALKNVTLSKSLKSIKGNAFDSCISLESITIPDTVTSI